MGQRWSLKIYEKCFALNENENTAYQNSQGAVTAELQGKFIASKAHVTG